MALDLFTKQIDNEYIRQNFERLEAAWNDLVFTLGDFEFFEFRVEGAQTDFKLYHNLGFNPNDVIVSKAIGSSYTFNYNGFNDDYITISTTGDLYLRCFIGNMRGDEVTGTFAGITDDLGDTGGGSGGFSFYKDRTILGAGFFTTRDITLPQAPVTDSERVYVNGLLLDDSNYTIAGSVISFDNGLNLEVGDEIDIRFAN
jgi:hypothetical protein